MQGKIAIEEHWESPEVDTPATFGFIDADYLAHLNQRLQDVDRRLEEMDAAGIAISVLSLTQPGVQGIEDTRKAVEFAQRMNDYAAESLARRDPSRLKTFACVPLQDPAGDGRHQRRRTAHPGEKDQGARDDGFVTPSAVPQCQDGRRARLPLSHL
jgi:2,3-dihydroxybenzoate decarboxylase